MVQPISPFAYADFRAYLLARFAGAIGQNALAVVIGWQVYDVARRTMAPGEAALQLGIIGLAQFIPLLLLTPLVGWTADRIDRRWIVRAAILLDAACAAVLAWLTWDGLVTLPALFAIAVLLGTARAFYNPAMTALASNLVPVAVMPRAIPLSSISWQTAAILGPAIGGGLYAIASTAPYIVATGVFLLSFLSLMTIRTALQLDIDRQADPFRQMIEGFRYVRRNRLVLGAISLDLFAVLLGGATAMLPIFARDILHVGPEGLGQLRMAPALGAALTALFLTRWPPTDHIGTKMLLAVATFGLGTIGFGLSRSLPLSLALLALVGAADMLSVYVRQSLIQIHTPNVMRGRVAAISTLFISGSNELGEAESGFLAALIGPVAAVVAGGIGAVLVTLIWARRFPELRHARTLAPPSPIDHDGLTQEKTT